MKNALIRQYFKEEDLTAISDAICRAELHTSGEIRVSVKEKISSGDKNKSLFERAGKEFNRLKMNQTEDKTGILFYIELANRQFYILADSGINEKALQNSWDAIRDDMLVEFKKGDFAGGIMLGIKKAGELLSQYFPVKAGDKNELSNKVEI